MRVRVCVREAAGGVARRGRGPKAVVCGGACVVLERGQRA